MQCSRTVVVGAVLRQKSPHPFHRHVEITTDVIQRPTRVADQRMGYSSQVIGSSLSFRLTKLSGGDLRLQSINHGRHLIASRLNQAFRQ